MSTLVPDQDPTFASELLLNDMKTGWRNGKLKLTKLSLHITIANHRRMCAPVCLLKN